jgi:hypothetical protein
LTGRGLEKSRKQYILYTVQFLTIINFRDQRLKNLRFRGVIMTWTGAFVRQEKFESQSFSRWWNSWAYRSFLPRRAFGFFCGSGTNIRG